jgi:WD40-like Beta Propeller Repeat
MMRAVRNVRGLAGAIALLAVFALPPERGSAVLPGENGKIAFASARDGNFEIYAVNPDTTGQARLTRDPSTDTDPAWSPDGKRIVFTTNRSGNDDIYLMNADGTGQVQLTTSTRLDQNPAWSPGGRNVVFLSDRDGDSEIFVMNEDGTGQTQLTSNTVPDATPAWSPDGTRIAFRSERDGNSEIYVMKVDGTDVTRLTTAPGMDVSPNWSPDGSKIAFASERDGPFEIYAMNADGSNQTRLTRNLDADLDPAWSPNGRQLAFTTNRDANNEIYVMDADGGSQTRLTTNAFEDTTSDWQWQNVVLPPPTPVTDAGFQGRWRESVYSGALEISGRVPGLSRVQLALRRGKRIHVARGLVLTKGSFTRRIAVPRNLLPGRYVLDVTAAGSPTELRAQKLTVLLEAPPEGVVRSAWASTTIGGPPLAILPPAPDAYAHFRFGSLPKPGRALVARWYWQGDLVGAPRRRPRSPLVIAGVFAKNAPELPRGAYQCVLRAGGTVVKRVSFRIV